MCLTGGGAITMVALHRDVSQPSRRTMTSSIGTTIVGSVFFFVPLPLTPVLGRRIHPPSAFRDLPLYKLSTAYHSSVSLCLNHSHNIQLIVTMISLFCINFLASVRVLYHSCISLFDISLTTVFLTHWLASLYCITLTAVDPHSLRHIAGERVHTSCFSVSWQQEASR